MIPLPEYCDTFDRVIGAHLRRLRLDAELTQLDIEHRSGIQRPIVARIESGRHLIDVRTLARYAAALELSWDSVVVVIDESWLAGAREAHEWAKRMEKAA